MLKYLPFEKRKDYLGYVFTVKEKYKVATGAPVARKEKLSIPHPRMKAEIEIMFRKSLDECTSQVGEVNEEAIHPWTPLGKTLTKQRNMMANLPSFS